RQVVAGRYRKGAQSLIGPELFPWWLFAVKAGLMLMVAIQVIVAVIHIVTGSSDASDVIGHAISGVIEAGLFIIGAATVAGALFEHYGYRPGFMTNWRVKDLPVFNLSDPDRWSETLQGRSGQAATPAKSSSGLWRAQALRGRWPGGEAVFSIVALLIFMSWWSGLWSVSGLETIAITDGRAQVFASPIWQANFVPIMLLAIGQLWIETIRLFRPQWVRFRAGLEVIASGVALAIVWTIFQYGHWFTLTENGSSMRIAGDWVLLDFDRLRAMSDSTRDLVGAGSTLSLILTWVGVAVMISLVFSIGRHLWRVVRG
ncbi:hypothetical protein, partial [uncultured Brevundimonas sp.]|uniref:hypothetical protein n=1 Tax=uncultured Brevundimonas sp. TaxID=213418 RepID=UPI0025D3873A